MCQVTSDTPEHEAIQSFMEFDTARASLDRLLEETDPFVCEACGEGCTSIQPCGACRDEMERRDVPYADADGLLVVDDRKGGCKP